MKRILVGLILALVTVVGAQTTIPGGGGGSSLSTPVSVANGGTGNATGAGLQSTCTSAVGTDAYACPTLTTGSCPASLALSTPVFMTTDVANAGASTFDLCSLGAKAIVRGAPTASTATVTGDMVAAYGYLLQYNATGDNFKLESIPASVALINQANAFTGLITSTAGFATGNTVYFAPGNNASTNGGYIFVTATTPDAPVLATGTTSNSLHFNESLDTAFDFNNGPCGTSACTHPTLIAHSATQDTTQYTSVSAGFIASKLVKTLTESAATSTFQLPVAALAGSGGEFKYCVHANDATDIQERCASIRFSVVNKAGTETCNMTAVAGTDDASITETEDGSGSGSISTGTLTYAITCDTTPANAIAIQINAVSSLTQTTLEARYSVYLTGPGQILPQ